jgi:cobalamin biosynthesis Mg chelatase CobN
MLAIERVPIYKNKLFLSTMSVLTGFVMTVGVIRAVNPPDTTSQQSVLSGSDGRASSLIPINASLSEASSESGNSKGETGAKAESSTSVSTPNRSVSNTSTGQVASSSTGTTSGQTATQTSVQSSSTGSQTQTGTEDGKATSKPSDSSPMCLATVLNIGLVCH